MNNQIIVFDNGNLIRFDTLKKATDFYSEEELIWNAEHKLYKVIYEEGETKKLKMWLNRMLNSVLNRVLN